MSASKVQRTRPSDWRAVTVSGTALLKSPSTSTATVVAPSAASSGTKATTRESVQVAVQAVRPAMWTVPAAPKPEPSMATRPLNGSSALLIEVMVGCAAAVAAAADSRTKASVWRSVIEWIPPLVRPC